jgi:dienelactone hydrolase
MGADCILGAPVKRWLLFSALVTLGTAACAPAAKDLKPSLEATDSGKIWFASAGTLPPSPDGSRFVPGDPVVLSGELGFPAGNGPFPAMVIAHGCGGNGAVDAAWARTLQEWGYATFVLDSFSGRGLVEVCTNARLLMGTQRIPDAYGALRALATHPRIDARRVALMGFSHGGILTLGAATTWARETFASEGRPAFRAFFPFYPYCNTIYPERERISAPLRIHIGEIDDWTPASSCIRLVEMLKASGQDAVITVYPGAHHGFPAEGLGFVRMRNVDNGAACNARLATILGPIVSPASELEGCLQKGATIAGNAEAAALSRQNVRAQLTELMK